MEVNGTYIWPDGTHVSGFHTNQPDGNGSCCQYWRGANALDDVNCSARLQFVCEMSFWMEWHINRIFLKIGQQWLVTICVTNWFWDTELPMMRKEGWGGPDPFYEDKPQSVSLMQVTVSQLFTFIKGHKQLQNTSLFGPFLADWNKLDSAFRVSNLTIKRNLVLFTFSCHCLFKILTWNTAQVNFMFHMRKSIRNAITLQSVGLLCVCN